jgi:hypothetical protein
MNVWPQIASQTPCTPSHRHGSETLSGPGTALMADRASWVLGFLLVALLDIWVGLSYP